MSLAARLINHIQSDGVVHTLGIIGRRLTIYASKYADRYFDRRYGAETSRFVEVAEMAVHSRNKERGIRYEPTRARPFRKLMRSLRFPRGSVFLDIGCGKGRVLIMASECGFGKTVGVEHSRELCRAARRNLDAYRRCTGRRIEAVIHECDALDYRFDDSENVITCSTLSTPSCWARSSISSRLHWREHREQSG